MHPVKNILIRLPNWLGDMVMATPLVKAIGLQYPDATIDVIAKKGIDFLLDSFPPHQHTYSFDKATYPGLAGAWKFGKEISKQKKYDLLFCMPDSLSSAVMARATNAKNRIGFSKEMRQLLLTDAYKKPRGKHRVEEYMCLLEKYTKQKLNTPPVELKVTAPLPPQFTAPYWVININSEASSRRLPAAKAVSIIQKIRTITQDTILLIGSPKESDFVNEVYAQLENKTNIISIAGKTSIAELTGLLSHAEIMLTTDSGPAHVSNALGTPTLVLFGAGNEKNTGPFNKNNSCVIRLGKLACEPCMNNVCKIYGIPECLLQLDENKIAESALQLLKNKN